MRVEVDFSPLAGLHYYKKYQKNDSRSKVNFSRQNTSLFISDSVNDKLIPNLNQNDKGKKDVSNNDINKLRKKSVSK